ncbi:MAG TPA: PDZ domain-containing protein [Pyrinomonadaceae bacterium]
MRFCRACGYRLGEGLDEYVETVRLNPRVSAEARPAAATADASPNSKTDPFQAQDWGALAQQQAAQARQLAAGASAKASKLNCRGGRKMNWMLWMIIAIVAISVTGGGLLTPFALRKRLSGAATTAAKKSYFGLESGFKSQDGGAFIPHISPPGGPADKAGLVGGDVVTSFDGQPVKGESDIQKLLAATPIGKTVDVVYLRDGQQRTTKLTTISKEEFDRLVEAFDDREDKGYLKEGTDIDRVIVPGMNIYGVRLNRISKSGPADIAGIKDGDIVIEFDGIPTRTRRELELRIERAQPYSTVTVVVIRDGQRMEIPVKVGVEP